MWILYVSIYAFLIGFFTIYRKKAVEISNVHFTLALSSLIGFLLIAWKYMEAVTLSWEYILLILVKSIIISASWTFELLAIKEAYLSVLQPISAIKVVFGFFAGILIFNEIATWSQFIGVFVVGIGIFLLNRTQKGNLFLLRKEANKKKERKILIFFIISCLFSETSAIIDKFSLGTITSTQMQWWFMLFCSIILIIVFVIYCIKNKKFMATKKDWKNIYIYTSAIILIVADQLLFRGLMDPNSKASIVSILKQITLIVSVIFGALIFKEKGLKNRLYFIAIILIGIIIILL